MKVSAQREALEQTLVDIGYETIMNEGTSLMRALQRANPATATMNPKERVMAAERIYIQSIFGCMAKVTSDFACSVCSYKTRSYKLCSSESVSGAKSLGGLCKSKHVHTRRWCSEALHCHDCATGNGSPQGIILYVASSWYFKYLLVLLHLVYTPG